MEEEEEEKEDEGEGQKDNDQLEFIQALKKHCHIKILNIEHTVCHVTGNICSLVHSSPQTSKTIAICRP